MIRNKKTKKAITLVELVIVLALMSIVTMLVFNFVNLSQKKGNELDVKQELQHDGNMISESMMKNILHCKSVETIDPVNSLEPGDNSINSIKVRLNGKGSLSSDLTKVNVEEIEYRLDNGALKLFAWRRDSDSDLLEEVEVQTIIENVSSIKVMNKKITDELFEVAADGTKRPKKSFNDYEGDEEDGNNDDRPRIKDLIKEEKGINLEILLEKKGIEYIHNFELNLRNSV